MAEIAKTDEVYHKWIMQVKEEFRQRKIRAASSVNREMLMFYWSLGRNMDILKSEFGRGSEFYKMISDDLKRELPDVKSFSPRNLRYMHNFYKLYSLEKITPQAVT